MSILAAGVNMHGHNRIAPNVSPHLHRLDGEQQVAFLDSYQRSPRQSPTPGIGASARLRVPRRLGRTYLPPPLFITRIVQLTVEFKEHFDLRHPCSSPSHGLQADLRCFAPTNFCCDLARLHPIKNGGR
jgi:hypothetical protein